MIKHKITCDGINRQGKACTGIFVAEKNATGTVEMFCPKCKHYYDVNWTTGQSVLTPTLTPQELARIKPWTRQ